MKVASYLLAACLTLLFSTAGHAADVPKHAFKKTYDQMLAELPNVQSQLVESEVDGMKRWAGNVPVGTANALIQINGKDKNAVTGLTVMLFFTPDTQDNDFTNAEALRDVLFQGLLGRGAAFETVNDFFVKELDRQQPIIRAGGKPNRGDKKIAQGTSLVSLELVKTPQGLMAIYAMKLL